MTTIIIPCYNEAKRLPAAAFTDFLRQENEYVFCFVDDGSKDSTIQILQSIASACPGQVLILPLSKNRGKAAAVREGMLYALEQRQDETIFGYLDADLAVSLSELRRMCEYFKQKSGLEVLIASRVKLLGYAITRKWYRHYLGRVFATVASLLLEMPVYDTQCGAKLFSRPVAAVVFREPFITSWIFDVEILLRFKVLLKKQTAALETKINEIPLLAWADIGGSKVRLRHYFLALLDFIKLYKLRRKSMKTGKDFVLYAREKKERG